MLKLGRSCFLLAILVSGHTFAAIGGTQAEFSSGKQHVALIELFTSEGCSSCPPADRWLTRLKAHPGLWNEFTPIAFHVDYWDHIGWNDKFAQAEFGDRQRRYAADGGARFVYTPGFFRSGSEWHGWRSEEALAGEDIEVGDLNVRISDEDVVARFDAPHDNYGQLILHVTVLGMNLETRVGAGENNGKTLHHDFVALGVVSVPLDKADTGYEAMIRLPEIGPSPTKRAIVAWVSDGNNQRPIQSVGGFLSARSASNE